MNRLLQAEEHALPATVYIPPDSPGYVPESDPEEDPEEDDDEDPKEDPCGYLSTEETMAMMRISHPMMTRMMMLILRRMRWRRSTKLLPTL
ncbi:hypothetical protein Tco_0331785 [Tanacetum coccineum]